MSDQEQYDEQEQAAQAGEDTGNVEPVGQPDQAVADEVADQDTGTDPVTGDQGAAPEVYEQPDDEAGPFVEPLDPEDFEKDDSGAVVGQQTPIDPLAVNPGNFNPDQPVSTSGPDVSTVSGVPTLPGNEDVEAQEEYRSYVDPDRGGSQASDTIAQPPSGQPADDDGE